jgi:hypothetical protein
MQAFPLRANEAGLAELPVWLAWKPIFTEPFARRRSLTTR